LDIAGLNKNNTPPTPFVCLLVLKVDKIMEKNIVKDKSVLFALNEEKCHELKVSPTSDEYLKVWVREPTWLEVEQAMTSLMNIDAKTQSFDIDLNGMYRYLVEKFVVRTEPNLTTLELIRLNPYIGSQLKEILPNPMDALAEDGEKNEE
tara:strand:- start:305 stop:751 length:447 start_codon:yes stop_codon:yes gene_type:complete